MILFLALFRKWFKGSFEETARRIGSRSLSRLDLNEVSIYVLVIGPGN